MPLINPYINKAEGRRQKAKISKKTKEVKNKNHFIINLLQAKLNSYFLSLWTNFCLLPFAFCLFVPAPSIYMLQSTPPYSLPDHILIDPEATDSAFMVWQPTEAVIVLGQSNQEDTAVHGDLAAADGILVYKRQTGGQTVILTPNTVVISVRLLSEKLENPQVYFKRINKLLINSLTNLGISDLQEKGISDITIGEKKILGSSIYRKRNMVFYHAVLNISETPEFIGRYLKHPVREPDYRTGRRHEDFVTSILLAGYALTSERIQEEICKVLSEDL